MAINGDAKFFNTVVNSQNNKALKKLKFSVMVVDRAD